MRALGNIFQHYFNPLHVYFRLRDLGVPQGAAISLSRFYEFNVLRRFWFAPEKARLEISTDLQCVDHKIAPKT